MTTLAPPLDPTLEPTFELITLRIGTQRLGVDIRYVTEINTRLRPFRAPVASAHIAGVLNLRGEVVTVLKLGTMLGLEERRAAAEAEPKYVLPSLKCVSFKLACTSSSIFSVSLSLIPCK